MLFIFIKPGTMREAGGCKEKKNYSFTTTDVVGVGF